MTDSLTPGAAGEAPGLTDVARPGLLGRLAVHTAIGPKRWLGVRAAGAWLRRSAIRDGAVAFDVQADDGVTLSAMWTPPAEGVRRRPTIVMAHGWAEFKELYLRRAARFAAAGHGVIVFDHRAHGQSTGSTIGFGAIEKRDLRRVIDAGVERGWIGEQGVLTLGHSMGAASVLLHAVEDDRVIGTVASAPFSRLRLAIESFRQCHAPMVAAPWVERQFQWFDQQGAYRLDDAMPEAAASRLRRPTLFVIAGRDRLLPSPIHAERVASAAPAALRYRVVLPKATHFTIWWKPWPRFHDRLLEFFDEAERLAAATA